MQRHALDTQQPDTHLRTAGPVFILADDLTGACDSGVAFLAAGRNVRVVLDPAHMDRLPTEPDSVLAVTTETRSSTQTEAAHQVAATLKLLQRKAIAPIHFKKIDSAARGHLAVETIAALDSSGAAIALVAPAFPQAGRTVLKGILTIRDAAHQNTTVSLRELFSGMASGDIGILRAAPARTIEQGIAQAIASGMRILLCDAQTQSDLDHLAIAASRLPHKILWAGSAGLAHAVAAMLPHAHPAEPIAPTRTGRTLLFVGTDHPVTTLQVEQLESHPRTPARTIHHIDWAAPSPQAIRATFTEAHTAALILTGGETAAYILRALEAATIRLAGELAPGIPWGILEGGLADGCMVVTKSGGFGDRHALIHAFAFCHETRTRRAHASA